MAHATVMARASAVNKGDIDDRFPDQGETGVRSMEYLPEIRRRLSEADQLLLGTVDVTILCGEQPRMKKQIPICSALLPPGSRISLDQVHVKVSSMDGQDEIAR